jgi:hypothetical protein
MRMQEERSYTTMLDHDQGLIKIDTYPVKVHSTTSR